ncbi:VTT domain-containing protein [Oscillospiraceae bacterium 38-13]
MKKHAVLLWALLVLAAWPFRAALSPENPALRSPRHTLAAAAVLLALYALKGLTGAIPITALEAAAGLLLPFPAALAANLCGAAAAQAGPYLLGRRTSLSGLAARYPRLAVLEGGRRVFLVRLAGVLPGELVSLWLGAAGVPWRSYFLWGLLGSFPRILAGTLLGASLWDLGGLRFWMSWVFGWSLTGAAVLALGREWALRPFSASGCPPRRRGESDTPPQSGS